MKSIRYGGIAPTIHESAFIADGAVILGDVVIGANSSVWFNCVLRGDVHEIRIGERTNIQDLTMCHTTYNKHPLHVGNNVTVGHKAMLHGCTIENTVLVGPHARHVQRSNIAFTDSHVESLKPAKWYYSGTGWLRPEIGGGSN